MGYWNSLNPPEFYDDDERCDIKTAFKELRSYGKDISNKLGDILFDIESMNNLFDEWKELMHGRQPSVLADDEDDRMYDQLQDEVYEFEKKAKALDEWMYHTMIFEP